MILTGDCIEQMKTLEADSIDALISDPPYAIAMDDWDKWKTLDEFHLWMCDVANEAYRVVRPGGTVAVFAAARTYHFTAMAFEKAGFKCRDMIEWIFWTGMPKGKNLKQCHEPIFLGWKPEKNLKNFTFNIDACRIPVKEKPKRGDKSVKVVEVGGLKMEVEA